MNRYTTLDDGSLFYDSPIECRNYFYAVDPEEPRRLIPLFRPCTRRRMTLRTIPECTLRRAKYFCEKFNKPVTVKDCGECNEPEP